MGVSVDVAVSIAVRFDELAEKFGLLILDRPHSHQTKLKLAMESGEAILDAGTNGLLSPQKSRLREIPTR